MERSRRLGRRLVAGALVPLVAALVVQAGYTVVSERAITDESLRNKAHSLAELTVNVVGPSIVFDDAKAIQEGLGYLNDPELAFAATVDVRGIVGAFRGEPAIRAEVEQDLRPSERPTTSSHGDLVIATQPVISDGRQVATVFVALRGTDVWAQVTHMSESAAAISLVGIALAILIVQLLARRVVRGNRQMRHVLDNVDEALANVRRDGSMSSECSRAFTEWFGAPGRQPFWRHIASGNDAAMLELAWGQLLEAVLPLELLVDQFPSKLVREGRHYRLQIKPMTTGDVVTSALLCVTDVTAEVEAQAAMSAHRDYAALIERMLADQDGTRELLRELTTLVARLEDSTLDLDEVRRVVHTLKGNSALFGLRAISDLAHRIEDRIEDAGALDEALVGELAGRWNDLVSRVSAHRGVGRDEVAVPRAELDALADAALVDATSTSHQLRWLAMESVEARLGALRPQLERAASQLGKPLPDVTIDARGVRVPWARLRPFWTTFVHVVRNAVDHGIETPAERACAGKSAQGHIDLRARTRDGKVSIELSDDGRGIDWEGVRHRASAAGLPSSSQEDLERALFMAGISTAARVTETSGRGVGLAAVREAIDALGGEVHVSSMPGKGTRWVFAFGLERA